MLEKRILLALLICLSSVSALSVDISEDAERETVFLWVAGCRLPVAGECCALFERDLAEVVT